MKNKMLWLVSLFVILLFVVSCAPKMSDEELSAELSKLSPEELEAVTSEDSGTFAGMAKASPKLTTLRAAYQSSGLKKASGTKDKLVDAIVVCGDGSIGGTETCDDGNINDDDGCDADCNVDITNGWECSGQPSVCKLKVQSVCGNGKVEAYEECDGTDFGGMDTACSVKGLGTGIISCAANCKYDYSKCVVQKTPICGDGVLEGTEQCEDGNLVNGDGCSSTCQIEQQQQACTPNQYVCDSVLYKKQCKSDGSGYNTPVKCADGEMCSNGNCVASLQKPDLVVSNVSFSLVFNATSGKNDVMYNVTLKNMGTVNSGFFSTKVQPMVSGVSANFFGDTIAAGKESSTLGKYQGEFICPGTHTLNVTADINWQVAESNEYNNNFWPFLVVTC